MFTEFPMSSMYLTPRAVGEAHKARVEVLRTNIDHMNGIIDLLHEKLPTERQRLHVPPKEMTLVLRWGGRFGLSSDARYQSAKDEQPYHGAVFFNAKHNNALPFSKAEIEEGEPTVIEMSVRRWDEPQFGARFAEALLGSGSYPAGILSESVALFMEPASIEETTKRRAIADCQEQFPLPLNTLIAY